MSYSYFYSIEPTDLVYGSSKKLSLKQWKEAYYFVFKIKYGDMCGIQSFCLRSGIATNTEGSVSV